MPRRGGTAGYRRNELPYVNDRESLDCQCATSGDIVGACPNGKLSVLVADRCGHGMHRLRGLSTSCLRFTAYNSARANLPRSRPITNGSNNGGQNRGGARSKAGGGGNRGSPLTPAGRGSPVPGRRGQAASPGITSTASIAPSMTGSSGGGRGGGGSGFAGGRGQRGAPRGGDFGRGGGGGGGRGGGPPPGEVFEGAGPAKVDDRLATIDQLITAFKKLQARNEMPRRPGFGTLGRPQLLRANFFALKTTKKTIYDYQVVIEPEVQARSENMARIFQSLEEHPEYKPHAGYIAHDRAQRLVSAVKLPQPLSVHVRMEEEKKQDARAHSKGGEKQNAQVHNKEGGKDHAPQQNPREFIVNIKFLRELDMTPLNEHMDGRPELENLDKSPLVSALNLVVQEHAQRNGIRVGQHDIRVGHRYFFRGSSDHQGLSSVIEAWRGFFVSVRPMYKQLMVNVNVCMTAFFVPGNLATAMSKFSHKGKDRMRMEFVQRVKVATAHLGYTRKKSILRIMSEPPRKLSFECEELGGEVTVEDYFKRKYNIKLLYPDLPAVDIGSKEKPNLIPPELCEIYEGQPVRGKLSVTDTAEMIKYACNPPIVNAHAIRDQGMPSLGLNPPATTLKAFGLSVSTNMVVIPSRVLPTPGVVYQTGTRSPRDGSWNLMDVKFHKGADMSNWAVLLIHGGRRDEFFGPKDPELMPFLNRFADMCRSSGISVGRSAPRIMATERLPPPDRDPHRRQALEQIRQTLVTNLGSKKKPSFILVLLSGLDNDIYPGIKRLGDVDLGIHTVHMLLDKARGDPSRPNKQDRYFSNVALKVNIKLGGINHMLDPKAMSWLTKSKTMLVGIDVTHPGSTSSKGTPSIAAVVASVDDKFVHYPASYSLQKPDWNKDAKELVENLSKMMVERLELWRKRNGSLPDRIIIFRDGVSDSQYRLVIQEELPRILDAFKRVSPRTTYRPKLTITICGKRHNARFFPTDLKDASKNGNPLPGTVIDKGITDIYGFDYYLQAHSGLQGHARPTHYYVVYDDSHFSADVLQQGTHTASYHYARATTAVSLVPPAYYAELACERSRCYLNNVLNPVNEQPAAGEKKPGRITEEKERQRNFDEAVKIWGNGIHDDIKESMFYI
ncbi:Piwi-domain-containing protein [Laetiporus sulphureus 93-53]|uniref:Piwi-domain-containing protein n=1 Tax=Laetiporus sulphureus 93-53 TaxID=1314785 RepID=A0A165BZN2_9APHY|nr:Piwi-domain-containing protein [Laetiporus sulphureus 93-53]KZT01939.1 Piwi-domain-containing protein [Laetiporus sulphureus 93-53]